MTFARAAVALALVVIILPGIAWTASAGFDESNQFGTTVDNETITANLETWQAVDDADRAFEFFDNETVRNSSDANLSEGEGDGSGDYDWNESDGTIRFHDTESVSDGEQMNVTYTYWEKTEFAKEMRAVMRPAVQNLPLFILGALAFGVTGIVFGIWRQLPTGGVSGGDFGR